MYSTKRYVYASHVGADKKMTVGAVGDFLGDCEQYQMDRDTEVSDYLRSHNTAVYVAARQTELYRFPSLNEKLEVATYVYDMTPIFGFRNTIIYDESGAEVVASF
ncbi:MAG: hypothetical protein LBS99_03775, partial [Clostridiales bacterium]|nr:hypothetical protein [Clostridiales bacterium]